MTTLAPCRDNNVLISIQAKNEGLSSEQEKGFNSFEKYRYEMEGSIEFPMDLTLYTN